MYEIPFLYVYENEDFYLKVHLFVPLRSGKKNIAASAIHHHNNYLLTTHAAFGPGYETILFEKEIKFDPGTRNAGLTIRERFTQAERPVHMVDSWEPHVVINPGSLSATLVLWSPDKKRATDTLRTNPVLKIFKRPIRRLIYMFGLYRKIGIAARETYQFYPMDKNFCAIPEDEFFAPTRAQSGPEVDDYSVKTVFAFMQRIGFNDHAFLRQLLGNKDVPEYYRKYIDMMLAGQYIEDTYAKEVINVPGGTITVEDIIKAANAG
jgi:hypothetical protein